MENEIIFIRHAQTKMDKEIPINDWDLTEEGYIHSEKVKDIDKFQDVDVLISSNEKKAYLTIKPLADKMGKEIIKIKNLGEIERVNSEMMPTEEYKEMKVKVFQDLDFTDHGWETCNHALERFSKTVKEIDKQYENKKIIISSHGTMMTLYFAKLQGKLDDLMSRWKSLGFCDYGIIKNGEVVKDIV
ncbi:histidine phosphatase family protein [archaeon]|jgi:2,3-bisphosphoglycerate-dependent phosphoglycerate mutase|nr:histidine phosphatase family protein [archaeon]